VLAGGGQEAKAAEEPKNLRFGFRQARRDEADKQLEGAQ